MRALLTLLAPALAAAQTPTPPEWGPYKAGKQQYTVATADVSDQHFYVYYPSNASAGEKFPLISYAHGAMSGGLGPLEYLQILYRTLFPQLASYGFYVVAPAGCNTGCKDKVNAPYTDCQPTERKDSFSGEQLKCIEWVQNQSKTSDPVFGAVDWDAGVGIAGHSMGGSATQASAYPECAKRYNIKAAVLHHTGGATTNMSVPLAAYTSTNDGCCEKPTIQAFADSTVHPKVLRDEVGWEHEEPMCGPGCTPERCSYTDATLPGGVPCSIMKSFKYNPYIAYMTAAWFKVILNGDKGAWHDSIFDKTNPQSLCNYANMSQCTIVE